MKSKTFLVAFFALTFTIPVFAGKKHSQRAMIEKMEAVPCGAKEHGLTGLGSVWASVGATHVNTDEKLCPQYLLRTDDMEGPTSAFQPQRILRNDLPRDVWYILATVFGAVFTYILAPVVVEIIKGRLARHHRQVPLH